MSKKAMVVDNDFFFVEFLTEVLEKRGYEVMKAYDGKEGISKLGERPVDILFVDLVMPKIDGEQLIKFARKKYPDAHFPIIAVSATLIERLDGLNKIGADYYIAKGPMEKMADHVNEYIDKIEKQPFPPPNGNNLLEPEKVYSRQVTMELMDSVSFHQAITESIWIGIIVLDKDARIMNANSLALDIINKSLEEVLNYPITAIFPKKVTTKLIDALKSVVQSEELKKSIFYAAIKSKEIRVIVSPFKIDSKIAGWIVAMEDTSDG
jgi:CheY-like chemotaxis protein